MPSAHLFYDDDDGGSGMSSVLGAPSFCTTEITCGRDGLAPIAITVSGSGRPPCTITTFSTCLMNSLST
jgi:hypothetical protein